MFTIFILPSVWHEYMKFIKYWVRKKTSVISESHLFCWCITTKTQADRHEKELPSEYREEWLCANIQNVSVMLDYIFWRCRNIKKGECQNHNDFDFSDMNLNKWNIWNQTNYCNIVFLKRTDYKHTSNVLNVSFV